MEKKAKSTFPKGFFSQPRPTVSSKEALNDVVPVKWDKDVVNGNKKSVVNISKMKKI